MPKESRMMCESSNIARVSPYPLRSSRTIKYKAIESLNESEWEDVLCVICMEPPHNAVLLTCSSSHSGCRPYMCGTGARHSNCFKQFRRNNRKKRSNAKTLHCPLCRGEVLETIKVAATARRFMNAKPRSCTAVDNCEFSGTYSQLDKHLKAEHRDLGTLKVDPRRQWMWEMMERRAEYVELMTAAGIPPHMHEVVHHFHHFSNNQQYLPVFQPNVNNGTVPNHIRSTHIRNELGPPNYAATFMPRLQFHPVNLYRGRSP